MDMIVKDDLKEQAKQILSLIEREEQSMLVILKRQEDGKRYSVDDILLQAKDRVLDRLNVEYNNIQIKLERLGV